jgi:hypothetical protein
MVFGAFISKNNIQNLIEQLFYLTMFGFSQNVTHTKGVTPKHGKILAKYKA